MRRLGLVPAIAVGILASQANAQSPASVCTPSFPATPTPICGERGTRNPNSTYPFVMAPAIVSNTQECAYLCARREVHTSSNHSSKYLCRSFFYDASNNHCQLWNADIEENVIKNDTSSQIYYHHKCYDCGIDECNQPPNVNLLDNPGFEGDFVGPWAEDDSFGPGAVGTPGHNSNFSYQTSQENILTQWFNNCRKTRYKITFNVKLSDAGDLQAGVGDAQFSLVRKSGTKGQWTSISAFFQGHKGVGFTFLSGENSLDNVVVNQVPSDLATTGPPLYFDNAGFESGYLKPWKVVLPFGYSHPSEYLKIVSPGLNGSKYALRADSFQINDFYLSQSIATKPNTDYMVSFDYKNSYGEANEFFPNVRLKYDYEHFEVYVINVFGIDLKGRKGRFAYPISAFADQTHVRFYIDLTLFKGNLTLDNFQLTEIAKFV